MEISFVSGLGLALAGGILGAAFGGLNSFVLCGFTAVAGSVIAMVTGDTSFNDLVTWGPVLGPHVAFAGGVAATAYAAKIKKISSGRMIHLALAGLEAPSVMMIGGVFGIIGYVLKYWFDALPLIHDLPWTNSFALSIVLSGFLVRLLFGKSGLFGSPKTDERRWSVDKKKDWTPWLGPSFNLLVTALAAAFPTAVIALFSPDGAVIFFGLSAVSLIFFQFGSRIPVILHVVLASQMAVLASGDIVWGLIFGLLAAFFADVCAGLFLLHGDTHIDPPAFALVVSYSLLPLLAVLNIFSLGQTTSLVILACLSAALPLAYRFLRRSDRKSCPPKRI
jgi:hypothetical protein